ncbi:MAG: TIGR03118 family protein [Alphaproteobacteria bacterium]|nr:TIGR03118 family protein [Alphaproteobacteria bacterium]
MIRKLGLVLAAALLSTTAFAGSSGSTYHLNYLTSNQKGVAARKDRNLVNPWGMWQFPERGGAMWVADNGSDKVATYRLASGRKQPVVFNAPGGPTGLALIPGRSDGTGDFKITNGDVTERSIFAVATEGGQIMGMNSDVDPQNAVVGYDGSAGGASFKGLGFLSERRELLAADFKNGVVDRIDNNFALENTFTDPNLPAGYAPFNVRVLRGKVLVAFAKQGDGGDEQKGAGFGFIDVFDHTGNMLQRLVDVGGALNAPWGMTEAPPAFGSFAGALLVGNFGDGKINVYDMTSGAQLGTLSGSDGNPLVIDGLWGLMSGPAGEVTFAAGPNDESNGLLGTIEVDAAGGAVVRK